MVYLNFEILNFMLIYIAFNRDMNAYNDNIFYLYRYM